MSEVSIISAVFCPHAPLCGKHWGVNGCASKVMVVFCPQCVLWPPSDQYCSPAAVGSVVDIVGALSLWLSFPPGEESSVFISCICFSPFFLILHIFFPFHPPRFRLSVTTYTPTGSIGFYFFKPLCHISITRQNGYGLLLGSHLHISISYIFQKVVRGFHSLSAAVIVWADWLYRGCRVRTLSGWRPFRTTHSLPLFLIWSHTCLTG